MTQKSEANKGISPAVHIVSPNGEKMGVCLNFFAKWVAGIAATIFATSLIGAFVFAWQSNAKLSSLEGLPRQVDRALVQIENNSNRIAENSREISEIKGQLRGAEYDK